MDAPTSASTTAPGGTPEGLNTTSPGRRGGRGRDRGRGSHSGGSEHQHEHALPRGRGRGGNQASRGQSRGNRDGAGSRGGRPLDKGKAPVTTASVEPGVPVAPAETDADAEEGEVCFICASNVQHTAVAPCNHRSCHICSLRLRALYKTKTCAHCRTESDHVIFTDDPAKNYDDFVIAEFYKSDDGLGIHFENLETYDDTRLLLQYNCPDGDCDVACLGWPDLHRHVKTAHGKVMCDLCTRNKKVFTHEHELFTFAELKRHQKFGDDNPGAIDQSGFKGHPECGFCRNRFYGDDELYTHCREKHERCHICDRQSDGGKKPQYFRDYNELENHFRKDHFLCPDRECLEKKFTVFDSEMDLKAHQIESHPNGLTKDALRDARRVNMSGFQLRSYEQEQEGRRRGEGRGGRGGRGRDPNSEPIPSSSAQPMTRAEIAYQRQMALQNAPSASGGYARGEGAAGPTPMEAFAARPRTSAEPASMTVPRPTRTTATASDVTNGMRNMAVNGSASNGGPQTPQDQARLLRHNAVTERAANMLRNNQIKMQEFRSSISAYRNSTITATELIEGFFALFDTASAELGKLIKELAEIFEIQTKREGLLKAWSDWKAINEDYPSLPGSATGQALSGGSTAHGGSRVLRLKSSTAQSSRSVTNQRASWNNTASNNIFPALPSAASSSRIGAKPGQTPWAGSSTSTTTSAPRAARAAPSTASRQGKANLTDNFPALPAAPKPTSTFFSPGYTGPGVRRDNSGRNTPVSAWGAGGGGGPGSSSAAGGANVEEAGGAGKKKGNKNKKQTLFHFG